MKKPFKTTDEQISILLSRGLLFDSIEDSKNKLSSSGYYEVINGYKDAFMINPKNDDEGFKPQTKFNQIYQLFSFDRDLRGTVMNALEIFEADLRQSIAYVVSENISENFLLYADRRQYRTGTKKWNPKKHAKTYPIDDLMETFKAICKSNSQPFKHYREDHGNIPPWILVKKLTFGNLIWWYKLLKSPEKSTVAARMFGVDRELLVMVPEFEPILGQLLDVYLDYRNTAAHGGRIYNHSSNEHKLDYSSYLHQLLEVSQAEYRLGKGRNKVGVVLKSLRIFADKEPHFKLLVGIVIYLNQYLKLNPEMQQFVEEAMEINFQDLLSQMPAEYNNG